jgi:hypothetical protein
VYQFAGTSVGAYNAAAMVAGAGQGLIESARRLCRIWLEEIARPEGGCENGIFRVRGGDLGAVRCMVRPAAVAHALQDGAFFLRGFPSAAARFAQVARPLGSDALTRALLEQFEVSALIDRSPFRNLLRRTVPLDSLRTAGLALKAVASNFDTGGVSVWTEGDIVDRVGHDAILASAAIPGFFAPVVVDGAVQVDGGALMNTPLVPALAGSDTLHVVYLDPAVDLIRIEDLQSTLGIIDRMMVMFFAFGMNQDIERVGDFNRSLGLLDARGPAAGSDPMARALARAEAAVAQWLPGQGDEFAPITIHRYHPTDDLGGALGFLDFSHGQVKKLIDRGYWDTVGHDCAASGCVLPGRKEVA